MRYWEMDMWRFMKYPADVAPVMRGMALGMALLSTM